MPLEEDLDGLNFSDDLDDDDSDDVSEATQIMPPRRFLELTAYLDLLRDAAYTPAQLWHGRPPRLTMVMGNPSADLDSMVSAVVFAYFQNSGVRGGSPMYGVRKQMPQTKSSEQLYMSLINMPKTNSQTDLQRLRPELGVALREAFKAGLKSGLKRDDRDLKWAKESSKDVEEFMCKKMLTTRDLVRQRVAFQEFGTLFEESRAEDRPLKSKQLLVLVDHNAPSMPPLSSRHISQSFTVIGCIDHHVDEDYVARISYIQPRIIQTGIGSCTSLVVKYLRSTGSWPDITKHTLDSSTQKYVDDTTSEDLDEQDVLALRQLSILALAPILIDSSNLKGGPGKVSDIDREAVAFLESQIGSISTASTETQSPWHRDQFYDDISDAKTNSLDDLTLIEIFDRDYKQWDDEIILGIASIIKPISWLLENICNHSGNFVDAVDLFEQQRDLGIFVFSTRGVKDKAKELGAVAFTKEGVKALEVFEKKAQKELDLEAWDGDVELRDMMMEVFGESECRMWWMKDTTKTRKQVAPLMRDAIKTSLKDTE